MCSQSESPQVDSPMSVNGEDHPSATVLITTKDRKEVLCRAIDSVLSQSVVVELLVVDDGSTDGTSELVQQKYPSVNLVRNEQPLGIIAARNRAAAIAQGDILFTLDDDAAFRTPEVVESVLGDFEHSRVGVVAIPYTNHWPDGTTQPPAAVPGRKAIDFPCSSIYPGGSNAKRRQLFVELGGYSGVGRQAEEPTYVIRLLDHGYVVRVSSSAEIDHYPERVETNWREIMYSGARNSMRFTFDFVPAVYLPRHLAGTVWNRFCAAFRKRRVGPAFLGVVRGIWEGITGLQGRRPVAPSTYRLMRRMANHPLPFSVIESELRPIVIDHDPPSRHPP